VRQEANKQHLPARFIRSATKAKWIFIYIWANTCYVSLAGSYVIVSPLRLVLFTSDKSGEIRIQSAFEQIAFALFNSLPRE